MYAIYLNMKKDHLQARKEKNEIKKALLSTLIGAIEIKAKNDGNREVSQKDDAFIEKTIHSFIESANLVISKKPDDLVAQEELKMLNQYVAEINVLKPPQMSEEQLIEIKKNFTEIGPFMKYLKDNHSGSFDPKLAQKVFKT